MSSTPSSTPAGKVKHRICPSCDRDVEIAGDAVEKCPTCGTKLVEIREEADDLLGTVIDGRFEVRSLLGQGGMGRVYRAWQRSVGREVAIKLMDRSFSREPMAVRRFLREARLASQLSQPNTVSVFDFGQVDDGRLFIAMELIRGKTLFEILRTEGVFSLARAVRIGTQICDALDAAHALQIVHRDLKLENVIVLDHPPGRDLLKVLDFGLAKVVGETASRATESGVVVGTPRYMAPETAMEGIANPPADIYAVGVILAELTIGASLWPEEQSLPALIAKKLDSRDIVERVPAALRPVLADMLDVAPERRPTAQAARQRLAALVSSSDTDVAASRPVVKSEISLAPTRPLQVASSTEIPVVVEAPTVPPVHGSASRGWMIAGGAVVLAGIVGLGVVLTRSPHRAATDATAALIIDGGHADARASTDDGTRTAPSIASGSAGSDDRDGGTTTNDAGTGSAVVATARIAIDTRPAGAQLLVDGKLVGLSPLTLDLPVGTPVSISAQAAGRRTASQKLTPARDARIHLELPAVRADTPTSDEKTPF